MNRRSFMQGILAAGVSPWVCTTAGVLMPVRTIRKPGIIELPAGYRRILGYTPIWVGVDLSEVVERIALQREMTLFGVLALGANKAFALK